MDMPPDVQRLIGDIVRLGTIASVDLPSATCRMKVGDITTGDLPWLEHRAGGLRTWAPPSVGEQAILLCAEGDIEAGVVLLGLFSDAHPAPADQANVTVHLFGDGARLSYDIAAHALVVELPDGATARIKAPGGLTIDGPLTVNGNTALNGDAHATGTVTGDADVVGGGKSLKGHKHSGVASGSATTGPAL